MLSEGVGKSRGTKTGGVQPLGTWSNSILTTGEMPISTENSGSGAINRIIEVNYSSEILVNDVRNVLALIRANYGWAGRAFIEALEDDEYREHAAKIYADYSHLVDKSGATEKQSMAAALILTADELVESLLFKSNAPLRVEDIAPFLTSKTEIDQNAKAYEWLLDLVASNPSKFKTNDFGDYSGECWGCLDDDYIYIIKSVFDTKMGEAGYNSTAFLSWAERNGKIVPDSSRHFTRMKKINGNGVRCLWIAQKKENDYTVGI